MRYPPLEGPRRQGTNFDRFHLIVVSLVSVLVAGCGIATQPPSQPTPQIIYVTPQPQATPQIIYVTPQPQATPQISGGAPTTPSPSTLAATASSAAGASPATRGLLYEAADTTAFEAWMSGDDWTAAGGQLLSAGAGDVRCESLLKSCSAVSVAPFSPAGTDYVVEAEIRVVKIVGTGICLVCYPSLFGLVVRGTDTNAFIIGVDYNTTAAATLIDVTADSLKQALTRRFDPKETWHTYRVTVSGDEVALDVDGKRLFDQLDNTALTPGSVGVVANAMQVAVRSIRVEALPTH